MVSKFLAWHRDNPRDLVAVEQTLRAQVGAVEITGRVDRLERDADGPGRRRGPEDRVAPPCRPRTWTGTPSSACTSWPCCSGRSSGSA